MTKRPAEPAKKRAPGGTSNVTNVKILLPVFTDADTPSSRRQNQKNIRGEGKWIRKQRHNDCESTQLRGYRSRLQECVHGSVLTRYITCESPSWTSHRSSWHRNIDSRTKHMITIPPNTLMYDCRRNLIAYSLRRFPGGLRFEREPAQHWVLLEEIFTVLGAQVVKADDVRLGVERFGLQQRLGERLRFDIGLRLFIRLQHMSDRGDGCIAGQVEYGIHDPGRIISLFRVGCRPRNGRSADRVGLRNHYEFVSVQMSYRLRENSWIDFCRTDCLWLFCGPNVGCFYLGVGSRLGKLLGRFELGVFAFSRLWAWLIEWFWFDRNLRDYGDEPRLRGWFSDERRRLGKTLQDWSGWSRHRRRLLGWPGVLHVSRLRLRSGRRHIRIRQVAVLQRSDILVVHI